MHFSSAHLLALGEGSTTDPAGSFDGHTATESARLISHLGSVVMTLDAAYQRTARGLAAAEERGDVEACEYFEAERATVARLYTRALRDLGEVKATTSTGLVLVGEVLAHLLDRFQHEACDQVLAVLVAFAENVSAALLAVSDPPREGPRRAGQSEPGFLVLATTVREVLKHRQEQTLGYMAAVAAAEADPVAAATIEAEFVENERQLGVQLDLLAGYRPREVPEIIALAEVVAVLVSQGVDAEGFQLVLPLSLTLCDVVIAQSSRGHP